MHLSMNLVRDDQVTLQDCYCIISKEERKRLKLQFKQNN